MIAPESITVPSRSKRTTGKRMDPWYRRPWGKLSAVRIGFNADMPSPRALLGVVAAVALVGAVTAAARLGAVPMSALVATPSEVSDGKVWLPLTGALVADRPVALSLAAFVVFGFATLARCGVRVLVAAALLGHLGATLLVYLGLAAVRALAPEAV